MKVWNGIWKKILVWNGRLLVWNGRKLPLWNMEKSSSIPFHTMPWLQADSLLLTNLTHTHAKNTTVTV